MLAKLVKYECKATARVMLPTLLALVIFTFVGRFSVGRIMAQESAGQSVGFLSGVALVSYILAIMGVAVIITAVVIQRFYKNLTGDEGYLMHTLPVKPSALIWSKLLVATLWQNLFGVGIMVSIGYLLAQPQLWELISGEMMMIWEMATRGLAMTPLWVTIFVVGMVLSTASNIIIIYAAIAVGHTMKNHRVLGAVLSYFGLSVISQVVAVPLLGILIPASLPLMGPQVAPADIQQFVGAVLVFVFAYGALSLVAYFIVTNYVFKKQLNLE